MKLLPRPPEIIEGLFYEENIVTITACANVGKTPLLQDWAFCISTGTPWCGRRVMKRPVLFIGHEAPGWRIAADWDRMSRIRGIAPPSEPDEFEAYMELGDIFETSTDTILGLLGKEGPERLNWLFARMKAKQRPVLLVDPFEMFFKLDKKDATSVVNIYQQCRRLRREVPGATFIFSFNRRKQERGFHAKMPSLLSDPNRWLEETSGASEIQTRSDTRLGLEWEGRSEDGIRIFSGYKRGESMSPMFIESVLIDEEGPQAYAGFRQVPAARLEHRQTLSPTHTDMWHYLNQEFTKEEALAAAEHLEASKATGYRFLERIEAAEMVTITDGGVYKKLATLPLSQGDIFG